MATRFWKNAINQKPARPMIGNVRRSIGWAVDIEEGQLAEDFTGRRWSMTVATAGEARQAENESRDQAKTKRKETEEETDAHRVLDAHIVNDPHNEGVTYTSLRESTGLSAPRFGAAVTRLKGRGDIVETAGTATVGNHAKRPARVLRRRCSENELPFQEAEADPSTTKRKPCAKTKRRRGATTKQQPSENNGRG